MRLAVLFVLAFALPSASAAPPVDYLRDIKPVLRARCFACHGVLRQKAKLRLDTAALIRKGGRHGPAVVPGKSGTSLLIEAVRGEGRPRMPPEKEGTALTARQIALLAAWIDQGARAPVEPTPEDPRNHWSFRPPVRPPLPRVARPDAVRNPIDAFIIAEHDRRGLRALPAAAKEVLLRRVYLDLVGLPPTRDDLHAFLADTSPDAYEKVVDRLLAAPQYGERWGRHWMDVWRYSDWYGRRSVPDWWNSAPQIWRWRDWIVRSLNADAGYDRMVRLMLAADEIAPDDDKAVVATGFIVRNWYALNPNQWMRDMVEHTAKSFLGLTFNCAHCHDHKYDPIRHEDYFRFRAFFEPIGLRQDRVPGEADPGPFRKYEYSVLHKVVRTGSIRVFDENPAAPTFMYALGDERNRIAGRAPVQPGVPEFLGGDPVTITGVKLPPAVSYPGLKTFVQREEIERCERAVAAARTKARRATAEADLLAVRARIAADNAALRHGPGDPAALARAAAKAERLAALRAREEQLLQAEQGRDAARRKAEAVPAGKARTQANVALQKAEQGVVSARKAVDAARKAQAEGGGTYTPLSPKYPTTSTGRRSALARWITSRKNPLTARVAVNHIWMRHFGRPLVETVFDFGRNGKRPTHPQLLDWLAVELMDSGWSMKHLHRLIVTSNTYRMRSAAGAGDSNRAKDPDNRWLWHFDRRRMEAEVVRDSILHAAAMLDWRMGGRELEGNVADTSRRRSLYFSTYPEEGGHPKFLEMFDAPDPCDCYRRTESLIPQQALALTNSRLLLEQGRRLAGKLWAQVGGAGREKALIVAAFEQVLTRRPTEAETAICRAFLRRQADLFRKTKTRGNSAPGTAAAVAPATDPALRAYEDLVQALFSHHDFVMVR